ncbi:hypothetical protein HYC85_030652 [Camellia sinensis]|uniref:MADS-box domain-containing protein n=1 Tax=Camellia sinensis TaxID=4442 RepID=A0A7J7G367_CAMSI|nr:hypothetical protein HYC85_030652 [Camellia sinensis]
MRKTRRRGTLTRQKRNQKMDIVYNMGRVKLKIKRLKSTSNQQVTYLRRRNGIFKKAKELSILCDIDIVLLMFSPTGKATLFRREPRHFQVSNCAYIKINIEEVITKFAQLTPQERTKRKLESLEALKKTFKKLNHDAVEKQELGRTSLKRCDIPHEDGGQGEDEGHKEESGRDEDDDDEGDEEELGTEDVKDEDEFSKEP